MSKKHDPRGVSLTLAAKLLGVSTEHGIPGRRDGDVDGVIPALVAAGIRRRKLIDFRPPVLWEGNKRRSRATGIVPWEELSRAQALQAARRDAAVKELLARNEP